MSRETFLETVRKAVAEGNQAGVPREVPRPPGLGYQGAGDDPAGRFVQELANAGGFGHIVHSASEAVAKVIELANKAAAKTAIVDGGAVVSRLGLKEALTREGFEVWQEPLEPGARAQELKETLFQADVGITGVDHIVAETGSVVVGSKPGQGRSLSLLPPVHIAIAERRQLLPDLFDSFDAWQASAAPGRPPDLPACITFITGPSKTGDIELRLVTGVHGPGELHVVVIDR